MLNQISNTVAATVGVSGYKSYSERAKYAVAMQELEAYLPVGSSSLQTPQPANLSGFIVQPYLGVVQTVGSPSSAGHCSSFGITGQFTNFGDGNIFENALSQGKFMQLTYAFYDVNDMLVPVCSYVIYQFPAFTFVHQGISGCYDMQDPDMAQQYTDTVASLNAQCP